MFNVMSEERWLRFCFHAELQAANYAWNRNSKGVLPMSEWTMRYLPNLMGTYSFTANPHAGKNLFPIELKSATQLAKKIKLKKNAKIGNIPMQLGAVQVNSETPFEVKFSPARKLSSIYLLNAVNANKKQIKQLHAQVNRDPSSGKPYGLRVGKYVLGYADGSKVGKDILLGRNIALLQYTSAACRYVKAGRAVYSLMPDQSKALLQTEWVNPFPDKQVTSLKIIITNPQAPLLLCAITVRDTKK